MAVRQANVKGIKFNDGPAGPNNGGFAEVSFDLISTVFTGGADTITLGGGGQEQGVPTTATLLTILQNRRRDGKTVNLTWVGGQVEQGLQAGVPLCPQAAAITGANITGVTLNTLPIGGAAASGNAQQAGWDRPATICVGYYTTGGG